MVRLFLLQHILEHTGWFPCHLPGKDQFLWCCDRPIEFLNHFWSKWSHSRFWNPGTTSKLYTLGRCFTRTAVVQSSGRQPPCRRLQGVSPTYCPSYGLEEQPIIRNNTTDFFYDSRPFVGLFLFCIVYDDKVAVSQNLGRRVVVARILL